MNTGIHSFPFSGGWFWTLQLDWGSFLIHMGAFHQLCELEDIDLNILEILLFFLVLFKPCRILQTVRRDFQSFSVFSSVDWVLELRGINWQTVLKLISDGKSCWSNQHEWKLKSDVFYNNLCWSILSQIALEKKTHRASILSEIENPVWSKIFLGQSLKAVGDMVDVADIKTPRAFIFVQ